MIGKFATNEIDSHPDVNRRQNTHIPLGRLAMKRMSSDLVGHLHQLIYRTFHRLHSD